MRHIDRIYIDGQFVTPHGRQTFELISPVTEQPIGQVRLGDAADIDAAVAAAKRAFPAFSRTPKAERVAMLRRLHDAVSARGDALVAAMVEEYGGPVKQGAWRTLLAPDSFRLAADVLETYDVSRWINDAEVVMTPLGVVAAITPWNSNAGFICGKLASAIAAGCTVVVKPSEMSAIQTDVLLDALHEAGLPRGVINVVVGSGAEAGDALTRHPDVAKVTFTGSTAVGKAILRAGAETLKRITLELGGKSPTILMPDADFAAAAPLVLAAGFGNSGQACIAGTRVLVPAARMAEFEAVIAVALTQAKVGDPADPTVDIGPLVSQRQWARVQGYIRKGLDEGARLLAGGEGRPEGLDRGWYVRPTIFTDVDNAMTIAREEIFGPVLSNIAYRDLDDAVAIANDTPYGLQAYVLGPDEDAARALAERLDAGRVMINAAQHEPLAPFGGFKQSGLGREMGVFGLEAFLEPKAVLGRKRLG